MAVQLTLDHDEPSPSFHTVPCTPYLRKGPAVSKSPVATVPELDTTTNLMQQKMGSQTPLFITLRSSPHLSSSVVQVPSISPRTPLTRDTNHHNSWSREQLVPSQSPFARKIQFVSSIEKTSSDESTAETLHLFSDDDNIFL